MHLCACALWCIFGAESSGHDPVTKHLWFFSSRSYALWNWLQFGSLSIHRQLHASHIRTSAFVILFCGFFFRFFSRFRTHSSSFRVWWYYLFWLKWCRLRTPIRSKTRCRCRCWFQSFLLSLFLSLRSHAINHSRRRKKKRRRRKRIIIIIINSRSSFSSFFWFNFYLSQFRAFQFISFGFSGFFFGSIWISSCLSFSSFRRWVCVWYQYLW